MLATSDPQRFLIGEVESGGIEGGGDGNASAIDVEPEFSTGSGSGDVPPAVTGSDELLTVKSPWEGSVMQSG